MIQGLVWRKLITGAWVRVNNDIGDKELGRGGIK